jgi:ribosome maturation factor RimP
MTAMPQVECLRTLAGPVVESAGLVLEELTVTPVGRRRLLRITVDLPEDARGGVPVAVVATVSQAISRALDGSDVMGQTPYVLEVSSPGVDRPLVEPRHWKRARGRLVVGRLAGGEHFQGRLTEVGVAGVVVAGRSLLWSELGFGRVEVEFGRAPDNGTEDGTGEDGTGEDGVEDHAEARTGGGTEGDTEGDTESIIEGDTEGDTVGIIEGTIEGSDAEGSA